MHPEIKETLQSSGPNPILDKAISDQIFSAVRSELLQEEAFLKKLEELLEKQARRAQARAVAYTFYILGFAGFVLAAILTLVIQLHP